MKMNQLHARGVRLSLDDFGTGYASLTRLKRLQLDPLNINRCFLHEMLNDLQGTAIVRAVIVLGHTTVSPALRRAA